MRQLHHGCPAYSPPPPAASPLLLPSRGRALLQPPARWAAAPCCSSSAASPRAPDPCLDPECPPRPLHPPVQSRTRAPDRASCGSAPTPPAASSPASPRNPPRSATASSPRLRARTAVAESHEPALPRARPPGPAPRPPGPGPPAPLCRRRRVRLLPPRCADSAVGAESGTTHAGWFPPASRPLEIPAGSPRLRPPSRAGPLASRAPASSPRLPASHVPGRWVAAPTHSSARLQVAPGLRSRRAGSARIPAARAPLAGSLLRLRPVPAGSRTPAPSPACAGRLRLRPVRLPAPAPCALRPAAPARSVAGWRKKREKKGGRVREKSRAGCPSRLRKKWPSAQPAGKKREREKRERGRLGEKEKGPTARCGRLLVQRKRGPTDQVNSWLTRKKKEKKCVRLSDMRPTAGCLAGCKEPDCYVGVRPPSRLRKTRKKTK
ncbi:hypothetical protein VPH35_109153 [Triticum aestivum]